MSEVMEFSDYISSLPEASTLEGKKILLSDGGEIESISTRCFAMQALASLPGGKVVRIRNVTSALIAIRRNMNYEAALIWVSSYAAGQPARTVAKEIYSHANYEWYINGASDTQATVYLCCASNVYQTVCVTSLFGETPLIEFVDSLPGDATAMVFT